MHSRFARLCPAVLVVALAVALTAGGLAPASADQGTGTAPGANTLAGSVDESLDGARAQAEQALSEAKSLFHGDRRARRAATSTDRPADASLVLRDLAQRVPDLSPSDRAAARAILARPTEGEGDPWGDGYAQDAEVQARCFTYVCVHWVTSTRDAATADQVELTGEVFDHVWRVEVTQMGYRQPLPDTTSEDNGGNGKLDIYLADVSADNIYGYCTSDDPHGGSSHTVSAYCVVDNDFEGFQSGPLPSLKVTAAHEFFHAVQFAYDWVEDRWFMESTAAWMETQVYPEIRDNLQFLRAASPLVSPDVPLDYFSGHYPQYGSWLFWAYLAQHLGRHGDPDPSIVRETWERVAGGLGDPDDYSMQGLRHVVEARGRSFSRVFADFATGNRFPRHTYDRSRGYPAAPVAKRFRLTTRHRSTGWMQTRLDHLSDVTVRFTAGKSLHGRLHLRVKLNAPPARRGGAATVTVHTRSGRLRVHHLELNRHGNGGIVVNMRHRKVRYIEATLVNASTRYTRCQVGGDGPISCSGKSRDDDRPFKFKATALRR